jgi:hypothetical protein
VERARYITQNYSALQGLKLLPFGLFMMLTSTRDLNWTWLGPQGDCTITLPMLIAAILLYFVIDRYYARRFGMVRQKHVDTQWLMGIAFLGLVFGVIILEAAVRPPFSILGLLISLLLVYAGLRTHRWYYWVVGLALALLNLLPILAGFTWRTFASGRFGFWWNISLGLAWVVLGVLDHLRLVSALKPIPGGQDA